MTLPSNGRWGGNWMNPEPTTRWGFYVRIEKEVKVSRLFFVAIEHSCSVITLKTRGEKTLEQTRSEGVEDRVRGGTAGYVFHTRSAQKTTHLDPHGGIVDVGLTAHGKSVW
tara:strand:+ start:28434 stop:28766 length:333 start_codon:yes stop_codon:yes gene_type:complete